MNEHVNDKAELQPELGELHPNPPSQFPFCSLSLI